MHQNQYSHISIKAQYWAKESNYGMGLLDIDGLSLDMRTFDEIVYLSSLRGLGFEEETYQQGKLHAIKIISFTSPMLRTCFRFNAHIS